MPKKHRVQVFEIEADGWTRERFESAVMRGAESGSAMFTSDGVHYLAQPLRWIETDAALAGVLWKCRGRNLPMERKGSDIIPLEIEEDSDLAEPMPFLISPREAIAMIVYNHEGPRYARLVPLLHEIGVGAPVVVAVKMNAKAIRQALRSRRITKFDIAVSGLRDAREIGDAHESVGLGIRAAKAVDGGRLQMTIGLDPTNRRKGTLSVGSIIEGCKRLIPFNGQGLETLKITCAEQVGDKADIINLLEHKIEFDINLDADVRHMDVDEAERQLRQALSAYKEEYGKKRG